jgi:hypothetical protein
MLDVRIRFRANRLGRGASKIWEVAAKNCDVFGRYGLPLSARLGALAVALRQLEQQTKGSRVAARRLACRAQQDRLQPGGASRAAVFGYRNLLSDDLANNVGERFNTQGASTRIAALPGLKPASRRTSAEKSSEWECPRRIVPLQWRQKERPWRGFRLFRSRVQTAVLGAKTDVPTWIPKFQHLNALFNWLDPDKRHQLTI